MNPRIYVAFDTSTLEVLHLMSKKQNRGLSDVVRKITEDWLERHEDRYWCDQALNASGELDSSEEVWKNVQN